MGAICFASEENENRITELENLLKDQEKEKEKLKKKLDDEKQRQKTYKSSKRHNDDKNVSSETIEKLTNEKKQVFKGMLQERKNVSKLEDEIQEYKQQINEMEQQMNTLKYDEKKARKRAEEAEKKKKYSKKQLNVSPTNSNSRSDKDKDKKQWGIGSVMDGIKIPVVDLPGFSSSNKSRSDPPFKVKPHKDSALKPYQKNKTATDSDGGGTSDDDFGGTTTADDDSTDPEIESKTTEILDHDYDPQTEATHVYKWIHGQKIDSKNKSAVKQLKQRLASLLTSRSEGYRQTLIVAYRDQYGKNLEKDIKRIIVKGHALEIIHGLLMTRAQYDAILISELLANWDMEPVADIICCRSIKQLHELHEAFKKKCKGDVKKQLQSLAQKDKKKTLVKVIGNILDLERKEHKNVDMNKVNEDLNFVLTTKNFKGETKQRLVLVFTANSVQYIKVLHDQFKLKQNNNLTVFIDKKLGPKSTAGHFCKTRILYALDTADYYAQKIKKLGSNYNKNRKKIADIFIQRMETDLDSIQRVWAMKKYGDGKDLKTWIVGKTSGSKSGYFLSQMLANCDRYTQFNKNDKRASKFEQMMMST